MIHYIDCACINVEGHKCNCSAYSDMDALRGKNIDLEDDIQVCKEKYTKLSNHLEKAVELLRRYAQDEPPMGTWLASEFIRKHDGIPVCGRKGKL